MSRNHAIPSSALAFSFLVLLSAGAVPAEPPAPQDVAFVARCDGSTQHYVVLLPEGFEGGKQYDLLIALHGHGSDRWQFVKDGRDECRAARDAAARGRLIFVSPDYRARTSWMGPKAEADLLQIIEDLKARHRVGRVVLCGGSMGGSAALTFAALHPKAVDGVMAMNGTANHFEYELFQEAIRESFGGTKAQIPEEYKRRSAEYWPERFTMPVVVTTGGRDALVPPESVLRLTGVLKKLGREVLVIHRPEGGHETNYADAQAALDYVLKRACSKRE